MKIFITGGTGFIGSNLIKRLIENNQSITILTRDKKKIKNFNQAGVTTIEGQLEDLNSYQKIFEQNFDLVYHLAAIPGMKWGFKEQDYNRFNVQATADLLKCCFSKIKRFIFCSSINALSKNNFLRDPYGKSKWQAEQIVGEYHNQGLETIIIRPAVVYGPFDIAGMMLKLIRLIKEKHFFLVGRGDNVLPLVYIDDLVKAFLKAQNCQFSGSAYEINGPDNLAFQKIVEEITLVLGVKSPGIKIPLGPARISAWLFELAGYLLKKEPLITQHRVDILIKNQNISNLNAQKELAYQPEVNFSKGLRETIKWYQEHGYL